MYIILYENLEVMINTDKGGSVREKEVLFNPLISFLFQIREKKVTITYNNH